MGGSFFIPKREAPTLLGVARWLNERGYDFASIDVVLRVVSTIQGKTAAASVRRMMKEMKSGDF